MEDNEVDGRPIRTKSCRYACEILFSKPERKLNPEWPISKVEDQSTVVGNGSLVKR
jgi:hypothetical protein